jgi:hypothetical protein
MKSVRPSGPPEEQGLDPSTEDGYVLARIDQRRTLREIAEMSGMPEERVNRIVDRLVRRGALQPVPPDEPPSRAALPADESGAYVYAALGAPVAEDEPAGDLFPESAIPAEAYELGYESSFDEAERTIASPSAFPDALSTGEFGSIAPPPIVPYEQVLREASARSQQSAAAEGDGTEDDVPWGEQVFHDAPPDESENELLGDSVAISQDEAHSYAEAFANGLAGLGDATAEEDPLVRAAAEGQPLELEELPPDAEVAGHVVAEPEREPEREPEPTPDEQATERNYRKIYETKFHKLMPDIRAGLAPQLKGPDLAALCLDPDPKVIASVMTNTTFGLDHARLIAFHHRTSSGLELIAARVDLVRDGLVFRRLVRNTQLGAGTLRRIMQPRRLGEIYKWALDRDLPENARNATRGLLRTKYTSQTQPEERAELILNTDARVLQMLSGCTIDARTTQILCGRQVYSAMFVQNIARFGASPPQLLAHLAKQPFVRRNAGLKKALMQHPNMPGDVKRSM